MQSFPWHLGWWSSGDNPQDCRTRVARVGLARGEISNKFREQLGQIKQGRRDSCKSLDFCSESMRRSCVDGLLESCDLILFAFAFRQILMYLSLALNLLQGQE